MRRGTSRLTVERCWWESGQGTIHYQVAGAGPPLVLVHGLSGSARWWARNVEPLARHCRVHVIDLFGFGSSRAGPPFVLAEAARQLVRWLDALNIKRASVVGHSMGGFIAADLAAAYPDRVERLALVDAVAVPLGRRHLQHVSALLRGLWYMPPGFLPILLTDAARAGPLTLCKAARELLSADLTPRLTHIRATTLLIWGERDALVPVALGQRLRAAIPRARLAVVPRAGHNPMWDAPEPFNRLLIEFLTTPTEVAGALGASRSAA